MQQQKPESILEELVQTQPEGKNLVAHAIYTLTSSEEIRQFLEEYSASGRGWSGPRGREERIDQLIGAYLETKQLLHSFSDSGQPYYSGETRQRWDDSLCWYQRLVELATLPEKEWLWDTMPGLVREGVLKREDARAALEKHLQNVIPTYELNARRMKHAELDPTTPGCWQERECKAREALADLNENKPVKYRGIELAA